MGRLAEAMADAAIVPNDVTTVAITHTHPDHINGLILPGGASAFPRLKHLFVPQEEIGLFQAEARLQRFHAMVEAIADGDHIAPDITVVAAHGHEIGHSGFKVVSGRDTLLIWGDIVHVPGVQFPRPDVTWVYDTDQSEARRSRLRIFDWAARDGLAVAGAHLDFPGVGFVERLGDAFRFKPLP
jgi:glyoxylase-like metal-dependent hydrolase (beta-lactamase superfamily II)